MQLLSFAAPPPCPLRRPARCAASARRAVSVRGYRPRARGWDGGTTSGLCAGCAGDSDSRVGRRGDCGAVPDARECGARWRHRRESASTQTRCRSSARRVSQKTDACVGGGLWIFIHSFNSFLVSVSFHGPAWEEADGVSKEASVMPACEEAGVQLAGACRVSACALRWPWRQIIRHWSQVMAETPSALEADDGRKHLYSVSGPYIDTWRYPPIRCHGPIWGGGVMAACLRYPVKTPLSHPLTPSRPDSPRLCPATQPTPRPTPPGPPPPRPSRRGSTREAWRTLVTRRRKLVTRRRKLFTRRRKPVTDPSSSRR